MVAGHYGCGGVYAAFRHQRVGLADLWLGHVQDVHVKHHQCAKAGIHRVHGHRHQYAQTPYRELTGWAAPAAGGPRSEELTAAQKVIDQEARLTISSELGHSRGQILAIYCGV